MTKLFPPNPSVRFLKLEAKSILKAHRNADPSCCDVLRHLYPFRRKSDPEILESQISLQKVQLALSMEYGLRNWKELIDRVSLRETIRNVSGLNGSKIQFRANGFVYDSYCLAVSEASRLLGKKIPYEDVLAWTTNAFAPGFDLGNDCKELWVAEAWVSRISSADIAWKGLGLSVIPLSEIPGNSFRESEILPLLRNVMASGKVIVSDCGWSHPEQPVEPWWAGIVVDIGKNGTVVGAHPNGRTDNIIEFPDAGNMQAVSPVSQKQDEASLIPRLFQESMRRIRGEGEEDKPFSKTEYMAFGIDAVDVWIQQMHEVPYFCPPCQERKGSGWQSAATVARAVSHRSETAAIFLRRHSENFSGEIRSCMIRISNCYDSIVSFLKPAIQSRDSDGYQSMIGNMDRQKIHAETVLVPVKNELAKAADEMEKALAVFGKENV